MPALAFGDDVQEPLGGWHVVGVAGGDRFPGVAGRVVGVGEPEGLQEPGFAVGAVVGQRLARPFARYQDAASGVAEMFAAVGLAVAMAWPLARVGVAGLDAVAEPVRAGGGAGFVAERGGEAVSVGALGVGAGVVAVGDVLGQVFGEVADAPVGVA